MVSIVAHRHSEGASIAMKEAFSGRPRSEEKIMQRVTLYHNPG
jgi:hypothetical protein